MGVAVAAPVGVGPLSRMSADTPTGVAPAADTGAATPPGVAPVARPPAALRAGDGSHLASPALSSRTDPRLPDHHAWPIPMPTARSSTAVAGIARDRASVRSSAPVEAASV